MKASRREFVATGLAGVAGIYARQTQPATAGPALKDEDGYRLWLRYAPPGDAADAYRSALRTISVAGTSPTTDVIRAELRQALTSMLGAAPPDATGTGPAALLIGTPAQSAAIRALKWDRELTALGREGFDPSNDAHRRSTGDRGRLERRDRRALRHVPPAAAHADGAADRPARHRRTPQGAAAACSTTGTTSTARSSAATPAGRSGSGTSCPARSIRATPTTRAPTRRSASTATVINNVNAERRSC